MKSFASELKRWRRAATQEVAASLLGVKLDTYRNWERARNTPSELAQETLRAKMRRIRL